MIALTNKYTSILLISILLVAVTLTVYLPVKGHDFITYDDEDYVVVNKHVQSGLTMANAGWALTTYHFGNWHPVTWLSYMVDYELFGLKPAGYHIVNLLFHIINTLLLFFILHRMTHALWRSAVVAALFALHPTHVESVAWIAERKDVLSAFFFMLTLGAYVFYTEKPGLKRYVPVFIFFGLGLMAKPMIVTLPFVLLLLDYWPLQHFHTGRGTPVIMGADVRTETVKERRKKGKKEKTQAAAQVKHSVSQEIPTVRWSAARNLILEKIPLFILSAISCVLTYIAQHQGGSVATLQAIPFIDRLQNAILSYLRYILKTIWPDNLSVFYPLMKVFPLWQVAGSFLLIIAITVTVIWMAKRFPYLVVGWFLFLGTLVPVIGLVQVGLQSMADRYVYIPGIGLFIMVVWGMYDLSAGWRQQKLIAGSLAVVALLVLTVSTWGYVQKWKNSETLFQHALRVTDDNHVAYFNLGLILSRQGKIDEALVNYEKALQIMPAHTDYLNNVGKALLRKGRTKESLTFFQEAIRVNDKNGLAHFNLGYILAYQGQYSEAERHLQKAINIDPDDFMACRILGDVMAIQGKLDDSLKYYFLALKQNANLPDVHFAVGRIMFKKGNYSDAVQSLKEAVRMNTEHAPAHHYLGRALLAVQRPAEAVVHFQEALRIQPKSESTRTYLDEALSLKKKSAGH